MAAVIGAEAEVEAEGEEEGVTVETAETAMIDSGITRGKVLHQNPQSQASNHLVFKAVAEEIRSLLEEGMCFVKDQLVLCL